MNMKINWCSISTTPSMADHKSGVATYCYIHIIRETGDNEGFFKNCYLNVMEGFACPSDPETCVRVGSPRAKWSQRRSQSESDSTDPNE